jgi:hypothetical protein
MPVLDALLNNPIYVSILVILISSLVGFYVNARARDRCLRDFDGFRITLEDKGGKITWGTMRVYSSGIELVYRTAYHDAEGHVENSYILYDKDLSDVQAIYRLHDDQSARNQRRRQRDIQHTYQPTIFRRGLRALRNVFSTFKDAIVQATNTVLGYRATQNPQNLILSQHKQLTASGAQFIVGSVGNAYEPILEHHIGEYVVVDIARGEHISEEHGILKEYSAKYIELLNVKVEIPLPVYLKIQPDQIQEQIGIEHQAETVRLTNPLDRALIVREIKSEAGSRKLNVAIPNREQHTIALQDEERDQDVTFEIDVRCLADLVLPRGVAVVRHAGKREKLSLDILLGLDELPRMPWVRRLFGDRKQRPDLATLTRRHSLDD